MIHIEKVMPNFVLVKADRIRVYYSYNIPVIVVLYNDNRPYTYVTDEYFSRRTTKHINSVVDYKDERTFKISSDEFKSMISTLTIMI